MCEKSQIVLACVVIGIGLEFLLAYLFDQKGW